MDHDRALDMPLSVSSLCRNATSIGRSGAKEMGAAAVGMT